jgi:hypothetical protein
MCAGRSRARVREGSWPRTLSAAFSVSAHENAQGWPRPARSSRARARDREARTLSRAFDALEGLLARDAGVCAAFERVSVHAPVRFDTSVRDVVTRLGRVNPSYELILHPDLYADEPAVAELGRRVVFENMDNQKRFGRTVADLQVVFDRFPAAGSASM